MADEITNTPNTAPEGAAEEKPRRATRTRKTTKRAADGETVQKAPRKRTTRTKAAAETAPAAEGAAASAGAASSAEISPEVAQARALAQISQASVVRRQRRAEARAEEALTAPAAPAKPRRRKAAAATSDEARGEHAAGGATVEAAAPAVAPAVEPAAPARKRRTKASAAAEAPAAEASAPKAAPAEASAEAPLVDPALRPHRRGRKPKAYIEAEKAAAAARAAGEGTAPSAVEASAAVAEAPATAGDAAVPAEKVAASSANATPEAAAPAASDGSAPAPAGKDAPASESVPAGEAAHPGRKRDQGARRTHAQRSEHNGGDRGNNGNGNNDRNDRRNRQQNRKNRNNRFSVPTEPTLSRDDLAAMKVAELREKARDLDIDTTGKKKAELVEEVYLAAARAEGFRDIKGILDMSNEGFGYIRAHGYMPSRDDAFVPANMVRAARLRPGDLIEGTLRPMRANDKFPGLAKIKSINGADPEAMRNRPKFSDLTPIYPNEQLKMEHGKDSITGRAIDIVSPIGKGQRGLIVSPPKAGKTTILKKICQSIAINNPEVHLICLLVDERPEEVTDMQRSIKGDVVASTFDMPADNHTRVSELVIERAKRIVEMGGDVVVVLDSITRLARAYNLAAPASGRILSGGVDSAALYPPKRFLGAARNIEGGGSLTILASALIDTGSKMDEVIFEEFKGTGNMELKLDRDLADRRIFPAIDPVASGTRNEDLLIPEQMRPFVWGIRRVLAGMPNTERCAQAFIKGLKSTNTNEEFLIRSARRAQEHGEF